MKKPKIYRKFYTLLVMPIRRTFGIGTTFYCPVPPRLSLVNLLRKWVSRRVWIPLDDKAPFKRLVVMQLANKTAVFGHLSRSVRQGKDEIAVTHWQDLA